MDRLNSILLHAGFDRRPHGDHFRVELLIAIRAFAVMTGDLDLEGSCDIRIDIERRSTPCL